MPTDERTPKIFQLRHRTRRAQTLIEVLVAIALLSVIVVMITGDLTNITKTDSAADRSIEISASNFLLGVMKSDPGFWDMGPGGSIDWAQGPNDPCYIALGPYTDTGPSSAARWHTIPTPRPDCQFPFSDVGAAQQGTPDPNASAAPVGDEVQYMWNAQFHNGDTNAADLTVWVRRDPSAPVFEYHAIRYVSPPEPGPTSSGGHGGGGGGGGNGSHTPNPGSGFGV